MATTEINVTDEELNALMDELEKQNQAIIEAVKEEKVEKQVTEVKRPEPEISISTDNANSEESAPVAEERILKIVKNDVKVETVKKEDEPKSSSSDLHYYVDVAEFRDQTAVSETNLDQCMIEQNSLRANFGVNAAYAEAQASRVKARFEVVEAMLYDHHRKELVAAGDKVTEKLVENSVKADSRWLKGKNMVIEAESIAAVNKALVESLKDRRDMIIQLGADRREEFKGEARTIAIREERDSIATRANSILRSSAVN